LFVGNDIRRKGGYDLIEVFATGAFGSAELHVMTNDLINIDHPNIFWHRGVIAYTPKWYSIFRSADIFVLTSYRDCFPNVLQEAAAFGLALIGSNVGGIPEIVHEGRNGFLVEPGDKEAISIALKTLIEEETLLLGMRYASRQLAEDKFDAKENFQEFFAILNLVAGG
jgi:glycosyltransferase involved in cell wall biosynthesis